MTVREPEYSGEDFSQLLADLLDRKTPRGAHGIPLAESTAPENQFGFEMEPPITDWAQATINSRKAAYRQENPHGDHDAILWRVKKRT